MVTTPGQFLSVELGRAQRGGELLVYIDKAHLRQDADMGYGWSVRADRPATFRSEATRPSTSSLARPDAILCLAT